MLPNIIGEDYFCIYPAIDTKSSISKTDINSKTGKIMNLEFYDDQGFKYTARLSAHVINADNGEYYIKLDTILDSNGVPLSAAQLMEVSFGATEIVNTADDYLRKTGVGLVQTISLSDGAATSPTEVDQEVGFVYTVDVGTAMDDAEIGAIYGPDAETLAVAGATYTIDRSGAITIVPPPGSGGTPVRFPIGSVAVPGSTASIDEIDLINNFTLNLSGGLPMVYTRSPLSTTGMFTANQADEDNLMDAIADIYGISMADVIEFEIAANGTLTVTRKEVENAAIIRYNPGNGKFNDIAGDLDGLAWLQFNQGGGTDMTNFKDIEINFLNTLTNNNNGKSTLGATAGGTGTEKGLGTGRRLGEMIEIVVQDDGRVYANYDNGMSRLLAQIATATFANPSGLEKKGDNLYAASMNSGSFDGIGEDIKSGGGYMTSGVLEMSNVDLSSEFTEMITTQRGFQANSRIITVSDSLLEELTNLKR
jgi:flagellar hook protein FlgE